MGQFVANSRILGLNRLGGDYLLLDMERPADFAFFAGQYTKLFFLKMPEKPIYLSIASPPASKNVQLCIASREPDVHRLYDEAFTNKERLYLAPPEGEFLLPNDRNQDFVFVAGGSGVSPVRSMCLDVVGQARSVTFILGGQRQEILPYYSEFSELAEQVEVFKFWPCVEKGDGRVFLGNPVDLFKSRIAELPNLANYFLCGPKPMMEAFAASARSAGVSEQQIFFERY